MTEADISQIRIGKHFFGIVGLKEAICALAASHIQADDDRIAGELLQRLSGRNYIPQNVRDAYGRAFVREFRKFCGQPHAEEDHPGGLEIKVLGGGCNVCNSLENEIMAVLTEMNVAGGLEHVRDAESIARYAVRGVPALVINGRVMSVGVVPSREQIKTWIEAAGHRLTSGGKVERPVFIKNIAFSEPLRLTDLVGYEEGRVVSRTLAQKATMGLTLFAFDKGESISTHTAPGDALVQVLDGKARITIDDQEVTVSAGESVVMPANVPHSVAAVERFKMLLTVVK